MNFINELSRTFKFGIPYSTVIDNLLELRSSEFQIDYFSCYRSENLENNHPTQYEYSSLYSSILEDKTVVKNNSIFPLFSFKNYLYFIMQSSANDRYFVDAFEYSKFEKDGFKKDNTYISMFYNMDFSTEYFEALLMDKIAFNKELIKYFISK